MPVLTRCLDGPHSSIAVSSQHATPSSRPPVPHGRQQRLRRVAISSGDGYLYPLMTMLLLSQAGLVTWRRTRPRDRLMCRLDRRRLDVLLAGGACPDASAALSMRARSLI